MTTINEQISKALSGLHEVQFSNVYDAQNNVVVHMTTPARKAREAIKAARDALIDVQALLQQSSGEEIKVKEADHG